MPKRELTYTEMLAILRRLAQTPRLSQEMVAEELRCRKQKVSQTLKAFRSMGWEEAGALCGEDLNVLALRPDFKDQMVEESRARKAQETGNRTITPRWTTWSFLPTRKASSP